MFLRLLVALGLISIISCQTPEEKAAAARVADLDSYLQTNQSGVDRFFDGLRAVHQQVPDVELSFSFEALSPEDTTVYGSMRMYQTVATASGEPIPTDPPIVVKGNTIALEYNHEYWTGDWVRILQTIRLSEDPQHFYKIQSRTEGEDWPDDITGTRDYLSEESRLELVAELKKTIDAMASCRYLIVMQPVYMVPGKSEGTSFDSGTLYGKGYLYDLERRELLHTFHSKNDNAMMVWGTGFGKEPDMDAALYSDLLQEMIFVVRDRVDDAFEGAQALQR